MAKLLYLFSTSGDGEQELARLFELEMTERGFLCRPLTEDPEKIEADATAILLIFPSFTENEEALVLRLADRTSLPLYGFAREATVVPPSDLTLLLRPFDVPYFCDTLASRSEEGRGAGESDSLAEGDVPYGNKPVGIDDPADPNVARTRAAGERAVRENAVGESTVEKSAAGKPGYAGAVREGELTLDETRRTVTFGGEEIPLTAKEFALLACLYTHRGTPLSRDELRKAVWGEELSKGDDLNDESSNDAAKDADDDSTNNFAKDEAKSGRTSDPSADNRVDVYVRYLRRKLDERYRVRRILTVRGRGYMLAAENEAPSAPTSAERKR